MNQIVNLFDYSEGKLFWKEQRGRINAGQEAGTLGQIGRMYVQVDKKKYLVHRIVWFLHHGSCPEFLDHIDGNPLNNKIENLRPATKQQNAMNRKVKSDSLLGIKGVFRKGSKFGASIYLNGTPHYLGTFNSQELAKQAYSSAAEQHFKEFARV